MDKPSWPVKRAHCGKDWTADVALECVSEAVARKAKVKNFINMQRKNKNWVIFSTLTESEEYTVI